MSNHFKCTIQNISRHAVPGQTIVGLHMSTVVGLWQWFSQKNVEGSNKWGGKASGARGRTSWTGGVRGENDNRFQKYFCVFNAELLQQKMFFIQFQEPLAYGIQLLAKMILNLAESLNLLNLAMNIFKCQNLNPSYLEQKTTIVNLLR